MMDPEQKGEDGGEVTDETLKKLQEQYLRNLKLQGVEGIRKAFIRQGTHKALICQIVCVYVWSSAYNCAWWYESREEGAACTHNKPCNSLAVD
eukprot:scaffold76429_cov22-Tisochrysis_lutea.AAC.6